MLPSGFSWLADVECSSWVPLVSTDDELIEERCPLTPSTSVNSTSWEESELSLDSNVSVLSYLEDEVESWEPSAKYSPELFVTVLSSSNESELSAWLFVLVLSSPAWGDELAVEVLEAELSESVVVFDE